MAARPRRPGQGPGFFPRTPLAYDSVPQVFSVSPNSDRVAGGASVTITGKNFRNQADGTAPSVLFDGVSATSIVVVSSTSITCNVPATADPAIVDVTVTIQGQTGTLSDGFTYYEPVISAITPSYTPISGGQVITIEGFNFDPSATYSVTFGGTPGTAVQVLDSQHIVVTNPSHAFGFVDVVVLIAGVEQARLNGGFQYTLLTRGEDIRRTPGVTIRDMLNNAPNTCTLTVDGTSNTPVNGEKIEILDAFDGDRRLFAGNVQSVDQRYEDQTDQIVWDVTAIDFTWLLNKYRPFGNYKNVSASLIVKDLVTRFARGFTHNHVQTKLAKVSVTFNGSEDFSTCLNKLAEAIGGGHWYVDYDQDVHFFHHLPPGIIIPQTSGPGAGSPMTVSEGAGIPTTFSFTPGIYLFQETFVYDNGVESALGPYSNAVVLNGTKGINFSVVPVGAAVGTHVVAKRRIYYTVFAPTGTSHRIRFCEITDNVITSFTTYFGATGADTAVVVALTANTNPPQTNLGMVAPVGPVGAFTVVQGTAPFTSPPVPPFDTGRTGTYTPGRWAFKVSSIYRNGTESLPSLASGAVNLDGVYGADFSDMPLGATIDSIDVVARKVYGSYGVRHNLPLATVVQQLRASKAAGTLVADYGSRIGYGDSANLQGLAGEVPSDYVALANIIGYSDLDALMVSYDEPDWSPNRTMLWTVIPNNTATSGTIMPGLGGGGLPRVSGDDAEDIQVWPNADGPSLENFDLPEDLDENSQYLLADPPLTVNFDMSQIRNRVYVVGPSTGTTLSARTGDSVLNVGDLSLFSPQGGQVLVNDQRLSYFGLSNSIGVGTISLTEALSVDLDLGTPVSSFFQADDTASQDYFAKVELDSNGNPTDGIHETTINDGSLTNFMQLYMRAYAELELFAWPIGTIRYSTRDPKTRSGVLVTANMSDPPCVGSFLIQDVTIDQIHDESDQLAPRYNVIASTVKFDLNDLLMQIASATNSSVNGGSFQSSQGSGSTVNDVDMSGRFGVFFHVPVSSTPNQRAVGMAALNSGGTILPVYDSAGADSKIGRPPSGPNRKWLTCATAASLLSSSGLTGSDTLFTEDNYTANMYIRTGLDVSKCIMWCGFVTPGVTLPTDKSGTNIKLLTFRYAPLDGDLGWVAVLQEIGVGHTQLVSAPLANVFPNTEYTMQIVTSGGPVSENCAVSFSVNGGPYTTYTWSQTIDANLVNGTIQWNLPIVNSVNGNGLIPMVGIVAKEAVSKKLLWRRTTIELV